MERDIYDSIDYIEFYVGSAFQWAYFHQKAMGFKLDAYSGPETGIKDRVSYALSQGNVKLIFTSALTPASEVAEHNYVHGDGVKDIVLKTHDIEEVNLDLKERGVTSLNNLENIKTEFGILKKAYINTYGVTKHSVLDYSEYENKTLPGFQEIDEGESWGLINAVDHVVGNVEMNMMDRWVDYYIRGMGFRQLISFDDKDISTEYSALKSKVVKYKNRDITFPINEPAYGKKKSQIQEYLDYYKTPGVQHIALRTDNIIETVEKMRKNGVRFLETPKSYYDNLEERVGKIDEDIEKLKELNILVDRDDRGYLLQIFTKPIADRPTFFYEIIQRKGAESFGKGNFKALFEAIEREQAKRGNL